MPTITEIFTLAIAPGSNISDSNDAAAKLKKEWCDTIATQQGIQKIWFGTAMETPGILQLFLNWKSKADQERFAGTDVYQQLRKKAAGPDGIPEVVQVDFQLGGGLEEALSAPVTEVATFYFDKAPPESARGGAKFLLEALIKEGHNILGWAYGTTHQEIEREGTKGKGNMLIVGWETVEAHAASHNGQVIKENIQLLTTPHVKTHEMHHVQAKTYQIN